MVTKNETIVNLLKKIRSEDNTSSEGLTILNDEDIAVRGGVDGACDCNIDITICFQNAPPRGPRPQPRPPKKPKPLEPWEPKPKR